jgi:hypothetical protein
VTARHRQPGHNRQKLSCTVHVVRGRKVPTCPHRSRRAIHPNMRPHGLRDVNLLTTVTRIASDRSDPCHQSHLSSHAKHAHLPTPSILVSTCTTLTIERTCTSNGPTSSRSQRLHISHSSPYACRTSSHENMPVIECSDADTRAHAHTPQCPSRARNPARPLEKYDNSRESKLGSSPIGWRVRAVVLGAWMCFGDEHLSMASYAVDLCCGCDE